VVGGSFIASNISTEHFIGMIGSAFIYGICVAVWEWGNIWSFSVLIWFFIPFLLASKVFTTPEFLEKRFNPELRLTFAVVTIVGNIVAFLAAVLYGGGLALNKMFGDGIRAVTGRVAEFFLTAPAAADPEALAHWQEMLGRWDLWFAIAALGIVAGIWAIYGGLRSVAWTDFFTVIVMVAGGIMVTLLGLHLLSGDSGSIAEGWRVMIERNRANSGVWKEAVAATAERIVSRPEYDRLSVIQPVTHTLAPWPALIGMFLSVSIWYNVINQFMIQRVLGAKNQYHARMGIVLAGYMKILMPFLVVIPGLILFALHPEWMLQPWEDIPKEADAGYVTMVQSIIPIGLRGLFLAALFGAIQSTVNSVLNSTATNFTLDIYRRYLRKDASERHYVRVGIFSSVVVLIIAILLGMFIAGQNFSLFNYIQTLYFFFAPPFAAVFVLGILFRRINGIGASVAVFGGFLLEFVMKVIGSGPPEWYQSFLLSKILAPGLPHWIQRLFILQAEYPGLPEWLQPFAMQAMVAWGFCVIVCIAVSLATFPPRPEQVTDTLTFNWHKLNIFEGLGGSWYRNVVFWWGLFVAVIIGLVIIYS
jgi:SSS family solute:Na+ symporter